MRPKKRKTVLDGRSAVEQPPSSRPTKGVARNEQLSPEKTLKDPRILTLDIESSPLEVYAWGIWDQQIPLDFIKVDWSILSYAAKWLGEKKIIYADTGGRGADMVRDDSVLLSDLWSLLNEADIVVAQNGKKFDVRKINARLIEKKWNPPSPFRIVDTMLEARRYFAFTSQKLKWTSEKLTDTPKDAHKKFPGFELWTECLRDNPEAWKEMRKYNCKDVLATEKVYLRLRPWIKTHPNVTVFSFKEGAACPACGSENVQLNGTVKTQVAVYSRYQCGACGMWARGKQLLNSTEVRKSKLV